MTSVSNVGREREDTLTLMNGLVGKGGICDKYNDLKGNKGFTDFVFLIDDIRKPVQEGGFGLTGYDRPYLDKLLRLIHNQDQAIIKMVDANRFRPTSAGINRCRQIYPWMS